MRIEGLFAIAFDDPQEDRVGLDTVIVAPRRDIAAGVRLTTDGGFVRLEKGSDPSVFLRLFELAPDGSRLLLYRLDARALGSNRSRAASELTRSTGGSLGNGAGRLYTEGRFGQPLWKGGDGTAERRYLETARLVISQFGRLAQVAFTQTRWQLLLTYLPYPDEALHAWYGHLDPAAPGHDPVLASRLRPHLDVLLGLVDEYVGTLSQLCGSDVALVVTSDHGQVGASREVKINAVLEAAGLLRRSPDGSVDAARSHFVFPPWAPGFLVAPAPVSESDLRVAEQALRAVVDETGHPAVTAVWRPGAPQSPPGLGGERGGALYFVLAPGYAPSAALATPVVAPRERTGVHTFSPGNPQMQVPLIAAGPGIPAGLPLGSLALVDIAPLVSSLLAIDPPRDAEGKLPSLAPSAEPTHASQ